jgi:RNA polymerase sigma factor (sigma-70 family)
MINIGIEQLRFELKKIEKQAGASIKRAYITGYNDCKQELKRPKDRNIRLDINTNLSVAIFGKDIFSLLNTREQRIIEMRFTKRMTLKQVADEFQVTVERVRQVESKALEIIRKTITK